MYRYFAGCYVTMRDGREAVFDIPSKRTYASEQEAVDAEGRNSWRLVHIGGLPGTDSFMAVFAAYGPGQIQTAADENGKMHLEETKGDLLYTVTEEEFDEYGGTAWQMFGISCDWEQVSALSVMQALCDESTAGTVLYLDHDSYSVREVEE